MSQKEDRDPMSDVRQRGLLEELRARFGDRCKAPPDDTGGALAIVSPIDASEVEFLAEIAHRSEVRILPVGASTVPGTDTSGALLVTFDLMRGMSLGERPEDTVEVEPGVPWIQLEDHLQQRGASLRVYPTSAPQTTVGGWLHLDGMGVGSYEFGWLSENVASVEIAGPGGTRRRVGGRELASARGEEAAIIVSATLETRPSAGDVPFAVAFDGPKGLTGAVREIASRGVPLWHLGLANAPMVRAVGHPEDEQILYGAYPGERSSETEGALWEAVARHDGRPLPAADAHRIWGSRFYPSGVAGGAPYPGSVLLPLEGLEYVLSQTGSRLGTVALQGSVSRTGEVLLLAFGHGAGDVSELGPSEKRALLDMACEQGGREYRGEPG